MKHTFNAFMDGEELGERFRVEAGSAEEATPEILFKMAEDPDTAPDAALESFGTKIWILRDGDPDPEIILNVLPVEDSE